jgi:hypothetical protein
MQHAKLFSHTAAARRHTQRGAVSPMVLILLIACAFVVLDLAATAVIRLAKSKPREVAVARALIDQAVSTLRLNGYDRIMSNSDIARGQYLRMWTVDSDSSSKTVRIMVSWPWRQPRYMVSDSMVMIPGSAPAASTAPVAGDSALPP